MNTALWRHDHTSDSLSQVAIDAPLWFTVDNASTHDRPDDAVMLAAIPPRGDVVAVALIPESLARVVKHNRVPVNAGMLTLRHADRIDLAAQSLWVAVGSEAELTEYSPSKHRADVYCFLTKARLHEGERIAICPGTPQQSCGTIYKLSAWEAMLTQPDFRCASCSFDPNQPAWHPRTQRPARRLDTVFALLRRGDAS